MGEKRVCLARLKWCVLGLVQSKFVPSKIVKHAFVTLLTFFLLYSAPSVSAVEDELSSSELSEFIHKAEADFVADLGLPQEALSNRSRRESLSLWIREGTSYDTVLDKLESINAAHGYSFRIIRDEKYLCIERTYYRKRSGMAISLMVVMDGDNKSSSASLSRSMYKLPISDS